MKPNPALRDPARMMATGGTGDRLCPYSGGFLPETDQDDESDDEKTGS